MRFTGQVTGGFLRHPRDEEVRLPCELPEGSWAKVRGEEIELLAMPGSALAEVTALAIGRGHDPLLPESCEEEARRLLADPGIHDPQLEDLTGLPFCTIDYETSRDLDQALYVEPEGKGHVVWYALADAAWYVRPGSALFDEALRRGSTYYLPGLIVPMLPLSLCEDLISLNPRVDRRAMVFRMHVDSHGICQRTEILRGRIHSRAKLDYEGVQRWLDGGPLDCDDPQVHASLRQLQQVGERRIREAESRNVIRYRRREVDVNVGGRGMRFLARASLRHDVERYGEQLSLLANIQGAHFLRRGDTDHDHVQPIYRTHQPPREQRLRELQEQIETLIRVHGLSHESWHWDAQGDTSLAVYLRQLPADPSAGVAAAIQQQALYTGGRSGFSPEPAGHHGVGAEVYARFTAPMREVVGVFLHKEAWEKLGQTPLPNAEDEATREAVISAADRAKGEQRALNREVNRMVIDRIFAGDLKQKSPWRPGTVMGLSGAKVHVQLDDPPIDVKVYVPDMEASRGHRLRADRSRATLNAAGTERRVTAVGDRVEVQVKRVDPERDRWVLDLRDRPQGSTVTG